MTTATPNGRLRANGVFEARGAADQDAPSWRWWIPANFDEEVLAAEIKPFLGNRARFCRADVDVRKELVLVIVIHRLTGLGNGCLPNSRNTDFYSSWKTVPQHHYRAPLTDGQAQLDDLSRFSQTWLFWRPELEVGALYIDHQNDVNRFVFHAQAHI